MTVTGNSVTITGLAFSATSVNAGQTFIEIYGNNTLISHNDLHCPPQGETFYMNTAILLWTNVVGGFISHNTITNLYYGIEMMGNSQSVVQFNNISGGQVGIYVATTQATMVDNSWSGVPNITCDILLDGVSGSYNVPLLSAGNNGGNVIVN